MTDYEARNAQGVLLATFGEPDLARAWVRDNAHRHEGLHVVEVTQVRRTVYRPRAALRLVAS